MLVSRILLLCIVGLSVLLNAQDGTGSGAWLDSKQNWNQPGAGIPRAPVSGEPQRTCGLSGASTGVRAPLNPQEKSLAQAGWHFYTPRASSPLGQQGGGGLALISAFTGTGFDGMCRENGYQIFVFSGDQFAGTLSPTPMWARQDGEIMLIDSIEGNRIVAEFKRYGKDDPLCCPTRTSRAEYEVRSEQGRPVLVLTNVTTRNN